MKKFVLGALAVIGGLYVLQYILITGLVLANAIMYAI